MSKTIHLLVSLILTVFMVGCAASATATETADGSLIITQAAQTVEAALTLMATTALQPTATMTVTPTASPTLSPAPTTAPVQAQPVSPALAATAVPVSSSTCNLAGFVSDVTISDGTEILGGNSFTKTWQLRNDGTCTWTSDYQLVFYSGSQMDGDSSADLLEEDDDTVSPGETVEVSVDLVAPETAGTYYGYWVLQSDSGESFGIGTTGSPFYVMIVVDTVATYTPTVTGTSAVTSTPTVTTQATGTPTTTPTDTPVPTSTPIPTEIPIPTEAPLATDTPVLVDTPSGS